MFELLGISDNKFFVREIIIFNVREIIFNATIDATCGYVLDKLWVCMRQIYYSEKL